MIKSILSLGLVIVAGGSLSACNKASDRDSPAAVNLEAPNHPEDQFGSAFGKDFRADPMSTPANVQDNDVTPVSDTAQPVPVQ